MAMKMGVFADIAACQLFSAEINRKISNLKIRNSLVSSVFADFQMKFAHCEQPTAKLCYVKTEIIHAFGRST